MAYSSFAPKKPIKPLFIHNSLYAQKIQIKDLIEMWDVQKEHGYTDVIGRVQSFHEFQHRKLKETFNTPVEVISSELHSKSSGETNP